MQTLTRTWPEKMFGVMNHDDKIRDKDGFTAAEYLMRNLAPDEFGIMKDAQNVVYFRTRPMRDAFQKRFGGLAVTLDKTDEGKRRDPSAVRHMLDAQPRGRTLGSRGRR